MKNKTRNYKKCKHLFKENKTMGTENNQRLSSLYLLVSHSLMLLSRATETSYRRKKKEQKQPAAININNRQYTCNSIIKLLLMASSITIGFSSQVNNHCHCLLPVCTILNFIKRDLFFFNNTPHYIEFCFYWTTTTPLEIHVATKYFSVSFFIKKKYFGFYFIFSNFLQME